MLYDQSRATPWGLSGFFVYASEKREERLRRGMKLRPWPWYPGPPMSSTASAAPDHWEIAEEIVQFIYRNPDRRVSIPEIARRCAFSPFYLNRLFRSVAGESIYEFEKRVRLGRAATRLLKEHGTSVTRIAAEAGYSPSNFAVAFKDKYGLSPSEWRESPAFPDSRLSEREFAEVLVRVASFRRGERRAEADRLGGRIVLERLAPITAYRRRFRGPFRMLAAEWLTFCEEAEAAAAEDEERNGALGHPRRALGISYEDPILAREDRFAYDLCIEVAAGRGSRYIRIDGGTYARFDRRCSPEDIRYAFNDLIGAAMPARGLRMAPNGFCVEIYRDQGIGGIFDISFYAPLELDL